MSHKLLIVKAWAHKKALMYGLLVMIVALFWPAIPLRSVSTWFDTLTSLFPTNILYPILVILTGSFTAIYVYKREKLKVCISSKSGGFASLIGFILGACPACIPAIGFFLPLTFTITLSYLSWIILLISVLVLLFVIYKQGAFRKV